MNATLITAGIACIIAAIVGGGLKAFAIEIRVLDSGRRQAALGAFGVLLLGAGLPLNSFLPAATILLSGQRSPSTDECRPWFRNPPPDRVTTMESGTADAELLAADKPKDRPIVVVVTEDGKPVGAVAFRIYEGNALFKITQVVNAGCEPLDSFRNESRGGDRHVLQNYDTVELTFGTLRYTLRLGFDSGTTKGQLNRIRMAGPTLDSAPPAATMRSPGQRSPSENECRPWFGNPPPDRVAVIESGTADAEVLAADKPKDRPVVVVVTEDGRPVGAVAFRLYEGNALFKITQVVNARCEPLDSFRNESRGGDRHVLQNDDTVELTLGTLKYTLRLGYHSGSIEGQLNRV